MKFLIRTRETISRELEQGLYLMMQKILFG